MDAEVSSILNFNFWNNTAKTLLLSILGNTVYSSDQSDNITALATALEDKPAQSSYTITNNLTNCTNSNDATDARTGTVYTATITADPTYTLTTVTVTMGGVDITVEAVSGGEISIASVSGNVVITATASIIETLTPVIANPPDYTTFAYATNTYAVSLVYQVGTITGGKMRCTFDKDVAKNWNAAVYIFDAENQPYKFSPYKSPENVDVSGAWNPYLVEPGGGTSYPTVADSFSIDIPDGCKAFLYIRPGVAPVYDETVITNSIEFRNWAKNGGVVVTVEG